VRLILSQKRRKRLWLLFVIFRDPHNSYEEKSKEALATSAWLSHPTARMHKASMFQPSGSDEMPY